MFRTNSYERNCWGLVIRGKGRISYEVIDHHGIIQVLEGPGLLIEDLPV